MVNRMSNTQISIIIPVYNSADTLKKCLDSIYEDGSCTFQLILVDDGSTDGSIDLLDSSRFELYRHEKNMGVAMARNTGIKYAKSDILLFLDSDIIISPGTLLQITEFFKDEEKQVLVGNYSMETPIETIWSQYKHFWIHWSYRSLPDQIPFIFTSFTAMRRIHLSGNNLFISEFSPLEDFELGYELSLANIPIHFSNHIQVTHIKIYTFFKFIKNEFLKSLASIKLFHNKRIFSSFIKEKRIGNINWVNGISPFLAIMSLVLLFQKQSYFWATGLVCFVALFFINRSFFRMIKEKKGVCYTFISSVIFIFDNLLFFMGVLWGVFLFSGMTLKNLIFPINSDRRIIKQVGA